MDNQEEPTREENFHIQQILQPDEELLEAVTGTGGVFGKMSKKKVSPSPQPGDEALL